MARDAATDRLLRGRYGALVSKEEVREAALKDPQCQAFTAIIERQMRRLKWTEDKHRDIRTEFNAARKKAVRAIERTNRARKVAFDRALKAWREREARKLELIHLTRLRKIEKLKMKFNLGAPPINMPVEQRVAFFRMRREVGYKMPAQKVEKETMARAAEQPELFPNGPANGDIDGAPNGPANGS
jgi:hypothetical protein